MRLFAACAALVMCLPAWAAAPDASMRPALRGGESVSMAPTRPKLRPSDVRVQAQGIVMPKRMRPSLRPVSAQSMAEAEAESALLLASAAIVLPQSSRPTVRPKGLADKVMGQRRQKRQAAQRGAVCGDVAIQGEAIGSVPGRIAGCGVKNAVRVRSIAGITLSQAAVMNCKTAKATKTWIERGAKPAIGTRGGGLAKLNVAAHYACRTRNNQAGARISEHGKGNAIDISGFTMRDGSTITLLKGWRNGRDGPALKKMWKAACGPFGTVLGPESNRFHQDHFHFDTASYRSGSYCR